jgi:cytochrome P450
VIVGNAWAILHDPRTYGPNTDTFNPDRFMRGDELNKDVPHPDAAFGFGRRTCAGQHVAESSAWLAMASILSTLDLKKKKGADGELITPTGEYTSGLVMYVF